MEPSSEFILVVVFFFIALFYSSIGFGGGSSYLALLSLFMADFQLIRTTALICNVAVVLGSVLLFYHRGLIDLRRFVPFIAVSIPAAFLGAQFRFSQQAFFVILSLALLTAALLLFWEISRRKEGELIPYSSSTTLGLGGGVGLLSGLVGIGGGIFLSPVLNLMRWDNSRKIAALASFFILVNSLSGLGGLLLSDNFRTRMPLLVFLLLAVVLGGQLGSRLTVKVLSPKLIKFLTACLVLYVGLRLLLDHAFGINFK